MSKYKEFKIGDEVYTEKVNWRSITPNTPYIVLNCYRPAEYVETSLVRCIDIRTDRGFISRYATDKFNKTESQIRQDKINEILNDNKTI